MTLHLVLIELVPVLILLAAGRQRIARVPLRPLYAGIASTAIIVVWHLPFAFDAALENPALHQAEHASFVIAGLLLWAPVLSPVTGAAEALAFLFVTRNVQAVLGNVLLWVPHPLYRDSGSLHDQRLAGAIMLGEGLLAGIVAAGWLFGRLLRDERRDEARPTGRYAPEASPRSGEAAELGISSRAGPARSATRRS
jgi:cytochrome c oxidase assembly factor CtaG